ncbi:pimeloyl-ACP methyl ester carboxylesterase [Nakamurella sp. UYEF19]|uniref:alpha/beta fold hydrolase n=1 Tax=Nakamurella sp. UYEF19 TaxID=1756392 RepID=UPI00339106CD
MADQLTPTHAVHSRLESSIGPLAALVGSPADDPRAVVLLVPGYTGSKEDFAPIIDPLVAEGFVTIAIDQPGQFESPGPDDETAYTPRALGLVIASVVAGFALDHPVLLLGHSFGGLVSREAVLAGADVSGLVLLCSGPAAFVSGNRFDALTAGAPVLREQGPQSLYDNGQRAAGADPDDPHPLARFYRRRFLESSRAGLLGMGGALLTEPDRTAELASALAGRGTPVAVVAGEADDAWPLPAQCAMAQTLGSELLLIPGGAHSPAVEAPQALLDVLLPLFSSWTH